MAAATAREQPTPTLSNTIMLPPRCLAHLCVATLIFAVAAARRAEAIDLLKLYPTTLTAGDLNGEHARPWEFTAADVFQVSRFRLEVTNQLTVETGIADLGIGHCADGAVWAVLLPRDGGQITSEAGNRTELISHVWLRFHPAELDRLFPPETVSATGRTNLASRIRLIANAKFNASYHAGPNAMIPERKDITVDADTVDGVRRFFAVDTQSRTAEYIGAFEKRVIKLPPAFDTKLAEAAFDKLWNAFDRDYAMFILRPEVDWNKLRDEYRPRALACKSTEEFADVCAGMLRPLRDLHVWFTLAGQNVPVFDRPRESNANPPACQRILGDLQSSARLPWAITKNRIGFIAIYNWSNEKIAAQFDDILERMRDTRGLVLDVRLNGGGDEPTAQKVAGRFLEKSLVYASSRFRNGPSHTNLTERQDREVSPRGPWRYDHPVVVLIGQKCMSSNESFIAMMSGDPNAVIMGDHTCGSSGNPEIVSLPLDMTVSVPRWIDYLPEGTPLDEHGFQPQVRFQALPGAFEGDRDDLLAAALGRLK
jgi:hypothetical protein